MRTTFSIMWRSNQKEERGKMRRVWLIVSFILVLTIAVLGTLGCVSKEEPTAIKT